MLLVMALIAAACSGDDSGEGSTTSATTTAPSTTEAPQACQGEVPVFATALATDPLDVDGTAGPGPGSVPALAGQLVRHWVRDGDVVIELRWPATAFPEGAATEVARAGGFEATVRGPNQNETQRSIAMIDVMPSGTDPCSRVSIEAIGTPPEAAFDELQAFLAGVRPVSEKEDYLSEVMAGRAPVTPGSGRTAGTCATAVAASLDDAGKPDETAIRRLVEAFLDDRAQGLAAEACLTVTGLRDFENADATGPIPGPCLFACEGPIEFHDGAVDIAGDGRAEVLATYRFSDGTDLRVRETMGVTAVADGSGGHIALIEGVSVGPESTVDEALARRIVEDFLDAVAEGRYEAAATYLVNEGYSDEVALRLGDLFGQSPDALFSAFCRTAACGAPYSIGETIDVEASARTLRVTFATTRGPVDVPMEVGMFEGLPTVGNLPPDGAALEPALRIDQRIFGEPYDGSLAVARDRAVQWITGDGGSDWLISYRMRFRPAWAAAGDHVVVGENADLGGGVFVVDETGGFAAVAEAPAELAGAGIVGDRHLAFVIDGPRLDAVDLHDGTRATLLNLEGRDESPYNADAAAGRLLVTLGAGESTWLEIYSIDEATLEVGRLLERIDPAGAVGHGYLSSDGTRIATTLDDSFFDPIRSVATFDASSGEVIGRWTVSGPASIDRLDYDGRWVVAEVSDGTLFVVDTVAGDVRRVQTGVGVRFG